MSVLGAQEDLIWVLEEIGIKSETSMDAMLGSHFSLTRKPE